MCPGQRCHRELIIHAAAGHCNNKWSVLLHLQTIPSSGILPLVLGLSGVLSLQLCSNFISVLAGASPPVQYYAVRRRILDGLEERSCTPSIYIPTLPSTAMDEYLVGVVYQLPWMQPEALRAPSYAVPPPPALPAHRSVQVDINARHGRDPPAPPFYTLF